MRKITLMLTEDELVSAMAEASIEIHMIALEEGHGEGWISERLKGMYYLLRALWRWAELPGSGRGGEEIGVKIRKRQEELMADQWYMSNLGYG